MVAVFSAGQPGPFFALCRRAERDDPAVQPGIRYATSLSHALPALSSPGFTRCIAGVASGLTLGIHGSLSRDPLVEFNIAGLLLRSQSGLASGSVGNLRGS